MSEAKKNKKKEENAKKQAVKSAYLIGIGAVLMVACLFVFFSGYLSSEDNAPSEEKTLTLFGLLDASQSDEEIEEHMSAFIAQNAGISDACEIAHFYNYDCGACQRLEPWLITFKADYPEVQITSYELHEVASRQVFEETKKEYNMESASVPIVFICGSVIEGVGAVQTHLEPMVLAVYDIKPREAPKIPGTLPLELSPS
ncbi:MAG: hypothetical protein LBV40_06890 [Methanomicrobiales archaeon]|jgi:thiol-disulfide isomerase/thioredoxin|nr:hypothetical protein [Methanomicrobiales archaeon]